MSLYYSNARTVLLLATATLACSAPAAELRFSGFGTAAGGSTLDKDSEYLVEPTSRGVYGDSVSFEPESIMGLQAQAIINERLRATLQIVSKGADDFSTNADWAYISYDIEPHLTLNAGRYRLPTFYYSESLDIGYSYYWIRPPVEVYRIFTSTLEGINLYHSAFADDLEISTQAWYGTADTDLDTGAVNVYFDVTRNTGINTTLNWDWLQLRLVYNEADIDITVTAPTPIPTPATTSKAIFTAVALMADLQRFDWRSEYIRSEDKNNDTSTAWYASLAYDIGDFKPHLTHAAERAREAPEAFDRTTDTLGLAWYFDQSIVFKVEYSESDTHYDQRTSEVKLVAMALDIVF